MRLEKLSLIIASLALGFLVAACSDDDPVKEPDQGADSTPGKLDKGVDSGPKKEGGADDKGPGKDGELPDGAPDKAVPDQEQPKTPDISLAKCIEAGAKSDKGTTADKGSTSKDSGSSTADSSSGSYTNTTCANPALITLKNDQATIKGDTTNSKDEYPSVDCSNSLGPWPGPQLYYRVTLEAGKTYDFTLTPKFDAALFAFPASTACNAKDINTACTGPSADPKNVYNSDNAGSSAKENVVITPKTTGAWIIAVDSYSTTTYGSYTLDVSLKKKMTHVTCNTPEKLVWSGTTAKSKGDTTGVSNYMQFSGSTSCVKNTAPGGDLFYTVDLVKGKAYRVQVDPSSSYNVSVYVFTSCTKIEATCVAGADTAYSGSAEKLLFTAPATGTYFIGVDSQYKAGTSLSYGTFDITVTEASTPKNDVCTGASAMTFKAGVAKASGDTTDATDKANFTSSSSCAASKAPGGDLFYSLSLTKGKTYRVKVTPSSSYNVGAYVFTSCTGVAATCIAGADSNYSGSAETFLFTAASTGTHYIGIDSQYAVGSTLSSGTFTLAVTEVIAPANNTCAGAAPKLVFKGGSVTAKGDTTNASDTVKFSSSTSCAGTTAPGPDVFFSVDLSSKKNYKIEVKPESGYDPAIYLFTSCTQPQATCLAGTNKGYTGTTEKFTVTPASSATHYIGVDSSSSSKVGKFTLTIKEFVAATNGMCAKPHGIPLPCAAIVGDTEGVKDEYAGAIKCGGSSALDGPQIYYQVEMKAKQMYRLALSPTFSAYLYVFPKKDCGTAADINKACGSGGTTGALLGSVSSGSTGNMFFQATTAGTYLVAVDSTSPSNAGTFMLAVSEYVPAPKDTCQTAKKITLVSGKATVTDKKTSSATNQLKKCGSTTLGATDLFYKFTPVTGKTYKITFKPKGSSGGRFAAWDGSHNCASGAVTTACGVIGSKYVTGGSSDTISITAKTGDIYFVADGLGSTYDVYDFTFEIAQQ